MKNFLAVVVSMILFSSVMTAFGVESDLSALSEECLTTEVKTAITKDLVLPQMWNETPVSWSSSNSDVIAIINAVGSVTRLNNDTNVTLTATVGETQKELNFIVIGKKTRVWASENFYRPTEVNAEINTTTAGYAAGTRSGFNNPYYGKTSNADQKATIKTNPNNPNDYALKLEANKMLLSQKYVFDGEQPSGIVTVKFKAYSELYNNTNADYRYFYFNSKPKTGNPTSAFTSLVSWNRNIMLNDTSNTITNAIPVSNNSANVDLEFKIDYTRHKFSLTKVNGLSININYATERDFQNNTLEDSLADIGFVGRTGTGDYVNILYIDDFVVTTPDVVGDTPQEKMDNYKAALKEQVLNGQSNFIKNSSFIKTDLNLNVLSQYIDFQVSWASSNQNAGIIDEINKKMVIKATDVSQATTLTATITYGNLTDTLSLDLFIGAKGETQQANYDSFESYEPSKKPTNPWFSEGIVVYDGNEHGNVAYSSANITYGGGNYENRITGDLQTFSADIKYAIPQGSSSSSRLASEILICNGPGSAYASTFIRFVYTPVEEGFIGRIEGYESTDAAIPLMYSTDEGFPMLDSWFNLKIEINEISRTYDVYINGKRINDKALNFMCGDNCNEYIYSAMLRVTPIGYLPLTQNIDNIYFTGNTVANAPWINAAADLAKAPATLNSVLKTVGDIAKTPITWSAIGDVTLKEMETAYEINEGFGSGTAVLTATATSTDGLTIKRNYNFLFDLKTDVSITNVKFTNASGGNAVGLTDGGKLESITTKGMDGFCYICIFEDEKLFDVKLISITEGVNIVNYLLPSTIAQKVLKIYIWNSNLNPLSAVKTY